MVYIIKFIRNHWSWERVSRPARLLVELSLLLSCAILAATLLIHVYTGGAAVGKMRVYALCAVLYRAPLGVLLLSSLGAVVVDDMARR